MRTRSGTGWRLKCSIRAWRWHCFNFRTANSAPLASGRITTGWPITLRKIPSAWLELPRSLDDPRQGAAELERVARKGLRGGMIWAEPPGERPYSDRVYDPFWAAAQAIHATPLSLHIRTERSCEASAIHLRSRSNAGVTPAQRRLSGFILGGVLERFPQLNRFGGKRYRLDWPFYPARLSIPTSGSDSPPRILFQSAQFSISAAMSAPHFRTIAWEW